MVTDPLLVTNALRSGARAGVVAACGVTAGCFVHIFAAAFTVLKWIGAAYLVWLGLKLLLAKPSDAMNLGASSDRMARAEGLKAIFLQGFGTNALNPKVALFGLWVNIAWALAAAWMARRVAAVHKTLYWVDKAAGAMFLGFGLKLALTDNPAR